MFFFFFFLMMMVLLMNFGVIVFSFKVSFLGFMNDFEILFNLWNLMFMFMVLIISMSVLLFSFSYMSSMFVNNFMVLYLLFLFSMFWLLLNNSFYWMMLGWDGLGVVSFLLIVFYSNYESSSNGLFTIFQNRIGDLFFVLFMIGNFSMVIWSSEILKWGIVFMCLGAMVKSAQFPFNSWLLAAMSAPTPISSLVHSSTLVVAGVYIMLQYSYCFLDCLDVVLWLSYMTLVVGLFGLLNESDYKKLIAYSTMSHVGLMLFMYSHQLFKLVYFHLNVHAMFKSLMFMCFGYVMLVSYHAQDYRLVTYMNLNPVIKMIYYYSCLCLSGLPFLSAFFSKDFMIEKMMEFHFNFFMIFSLLLFLGLSVYYSLKLLKIYSVVFVYNSVEKNYLGLFSVVLMSFVMIGMINIYMSLLISVSLELVSFKFSIYLIMVIFFLLSLLSKLNYKWESYSKFMNMKEIWLLNYYFLDQYMYWNYFILMEQVFKLSSVKLVLMFNWWVVILWMVLF